MARKAASLTAVILAGSLYAGPNGDRPDATHAWAVHDENRPRPVQIETPEGKPPSGRHSVRQWYATMCH